MKALIVILMLVVSGRAVAEEMVAEVLEENDGYVILPVPAEIKLHRKGKRVDYVIIAEDSESATQARSRGIPNSIVLESNGQNSLSLAGLVDEGAEECPLLQRQPEPAPKKGPQAPGVEKEISLSKLEKEVIDLVNKERERLGLNPLTVSKDLVEGSREHSTWMKSVNKMEHADLSLTNANGENIAYGQRSAEQVMKDWMNSPGHRRNILDPNFTTIGVGVSKKNGVIWWTQRFAL